MTAEGQPAKQNGNERGGATCAHQGIWGRSGEKTSRTEQERRGSSSSAPARASARNRCWMDGFTTPQPEPPCRGERSPMWRAKTSASVGGVVFA